LVSAQQPSYISDNMTSRRQIDIFQGTLDLLILRTLRNESIHVWAISERIQQISKGVLQLNQGSLYPALHRLEHRGWIWVESRISELGRRARFYDLTPAGRKQLEQRFRDWERLTRGDRPCNADGPIVGIGAKRYGLERSAGRT
jgi:transcriptional regulator